MNPAGADQIEPNARRLHEIGHASGEHHQRQRLSQFGLGHGAVVGQRYQTLQLLEIALGRMHRPDGQNRQSCFTTGCEAGERIAIGTIDVEPRQVPEPVMVDEAVGRPTGGPGCQPQDGGQLRVAASGLLEFRDMMGRHRLVGRDQDGEPDEFAIMHVEHAHIEGQRRVGCVVGGQQLF